MGRKYYLQIAADMLVSGHEKGNIVGVNPHLRTDLDNVDKMIRKANGRLISRQVIAHTILEWKARNMNLEPYSMINEKAPIKS